MATNPPRFLQRLQDNIDLIPPNGDIKPPSLLGLNSTFNDFKQKITQVEEEWGEDNKRQFHVVLIDMEQTLHQFPEMRKYRRQHAEGLKIELDIAMVKKEIAEAEKFTKAQTAFIHENVPENLAEQSQYLEKGLGDENSNKVSVFESLSNLIKSLASKLLKSQIDAHMSATIDYLTSRSLDLIQYLGTWFEMILKFFGGL